MKFRSNPVWLIHPKPATISIENRHLFFTKMPLILIDNIKLFPLEFLHQCGCRSSTHCRHLANGAWNVRSHYKADRPIKISALQQMTLLVRLTVYTSLAFVSLFYFMKNWYKDATNVE